MKEKLKKINNKWVRLAVIVIVVGNAVATMFGYPLLPFDNDQIIAGVSAVALGGSEVWNHWKNNNYTGKAKQAQNYLDEIKE
ncbi:phage holin [Virgibacillus sp. CBA3643]|uniref:phage holin n=1 Tax=Virgibacillus sp. CBA3643 TaxID=2942278 RepID=UPI0035A300B9